MAKIYQDAKDKNVALNVVYAKAADTYAYADEGTTVKLDAETLKDYFYKGCVIVLSGVEYKPISAAYNTDDEYETLTYVKADTTTATTAVLALLHSKEYTA